MTAYYRTEEEKMVVGDSWILGTWGGSDFDGEEGTRVKAGSRTED